MKLILLAATALIAAPVLTVLLAGLLPGFGDAAFWLLDAGLSVKELSWAEVVDPSVLDPGTVPVLLHAGGENYSSRGRTDDDVLPARRSRS